MKKIIIMLFVFPLLSSYALAGKPAKLQGQICDSGKVVVGIDENNLLICEDISNLIGPACTGEAPVIGTIGYSPSDPYVGDLVSLDISDAYDPESDPITINSEWIDLPAGSQAKLTPEVGTTPAFYPDVPGVYIIRVTVSDDQGCKTASDVSIEVLADPNPNHAPVITSAYFVPADPSTNDDITCVATAVDQDGDNITFLYEWTVDGNVLAGNTSTLSNTQTAPGSSVVCSVTADDGIEYSETVDVGVTVSN